LSIDSLLRLSVPGGPVCRVLRAEWLFSGKCRWTKGLMWLACFTVTFRSPGLDVLRQTSKRPEDRVATSRLTGNESFPLARYGFKHDMSL
jgi:hypothetical protein